MTTDLKTLMHNTAADAPSAANLLSGSRAAAHRIRRRRRVVATATAGTALGAAGLFVRTGLPLGSTVDASDSALGTAAAASTGPAVPAAKTPAVEPSTQAGPSLPDCAGVIGSTPRDVASGELAMRLLSNDAAYQLEWVQAAEMTADCLRPPAAITLTDAGTDGVIHRAVTLWGPRATPVSYEHYMGTVTHTTVRGVDAQLATIGKSFRLAWTESSGQSWEITGTGMPVSALVQIADTLTIDTVSAELPVVPAGYQLFGRSAARASAKTKEWFVAYKTGADRLLLSSSDRPNLLAESVSLGDPDMWRFTTVRGHRALALAKDGKLVDLTWQEEGVPVSVTSETGATPVSALEKFAESLRPVDAGDARIGLKLRSVLGSDSSSPPATQPTPDSASAPMSASSASSKAG